MKRRLSIMLAMLILLSMAVTPAAMAFQGPATDDTPLSVDDLIPRSRRFDVVRDTFIDGSRPAAYFGDAGTMWVGFNDRMRPLVHAPITGIPRDAIVDEAWLYLYIVEGRPDVPWIHSVIESVNAHAVTSEWLPVGVNWNTPWSAPGGDLGPALGSTHIGRGKIGTWARFDVTAAVAAIVAGDAPNYGFIFTSDRDETLSMEKALLSVRYGFATKEYWDASKVPYLRVKYRTATN